MGARFDRLRCEVFQNLFLSPMNTGFVRPAVATVPTVYGIETILMQNPRPSLNSLQQYLPFTVLKLKGFKVEGAFSKVATVPTVYGIETGHIAEVPFEMNMLQQYLPFTVLKQSSRRNF